MSHSEEHDDDPKEQESNSNKDKTQELYTKTLHTVPFFSANSEGNIMLSEQSVGYGSARTPTPNEELGNEETYKTLSNICEIVEQKP